MRLQTVSSRMIKAAGYDETQRTLHVVFSTGHVYRYKKVPSSEYDALMKAESKGDYMHKHIIGHYDYDKIDK